jgi:hypothetical protein
MSYLLLLLIMALVMVTPELAMTFYLAGRAMFWVIGVIIQTLFTLALFIAIQLVAVSLAGYVLLRNILMRMRTK